MELIVAVALTCILSAVLALLVIIADAVLLNYGECAVTVNKDKEIKLRGGGALLAALMDNKIFIPSACGGRGSCGLCKVKVHKGGGEVLPTEEPYLTAEEIGENVRLSCQIKIRSDVDVEVPEELLSVREYVTTVEKLADLNYDTKFLRLKLAEREEIHFKAGQFVQFQVPPYGSSREPVYRAYSIASAPSDKTHIDLIIRLVPSGICTTYVFEVLKEGAKVTINGPYGKFLLSDSAEELAFIAGGSGIAPILSILHDMKEKGIDRKATFYYGVSTPRDLYLYEETKRIEKELPRFAYVPSIARVPPDHNWDGEVGLVTEVLERRVKEGQVKEAYLCGSPGMIDAAIEVLHRKGIGDASIFYDKFA
ncbi:MAG: FAD-binding oxidoreductase [Planctomycetota bacterium]